MRQRSVIEGIVANRRQRFWQSDGGQISIVKRGSANRYDGIRYNQLCQVRLTNGTLLNGDQRIRKTDFRQARFVEGKTTDRLKRGRQNHRQEEIVLTECELGNRCRPFFNSQLITIECVIKTH